MLFPTPHHADGHPSGSGSLREGHALIHHTAVAEAPMDPASSSPESMQRLSIGPLGHSYVLGHGQQATKRNSLSFSSLLLLSPQLSPCLPFHRRAHTEAPVQPSRRTHASISRGRRVSARLRKTMVRVLPLFLLTLPRDPQANSPQQERCH